MNRASITSLVFLGWLTLLIHPSWSHAQQPPAHSILPENQPLSKNALTALDRFEWVTLHYSGNRPPPEPIPAVRQAIEGRTTLMLHPEQRWIEYQPERLREFPFLHVEMCELPPKTNLREKWLWRDFFNAGGTLFLDACGSKNPGGLPITSSKLYRAWRLWGGSIFPATSWSPLNRNHALTFSFYLLEKRVFLEESGTPIHLLENDGRVILLLNLSRKWSWETLKRSAVTVNPNSEPSETRLRLYINLLMLLLTGDYKEDQQHLPTILLRRK